MSCNLLAPCRVVVKGKVINEPLRALNLTSLVVDNVSPPQDGDGERPSVSERATMGVKDFILDGSQLKGRTVTVKGDAQCNGTSCWLTEREWTSQQVAQFEGSDLSRDDRKRLLSCGGLFKEGCSAEVTGMVLSDFVGVSLRASAIVWR